MAAGRRRAHDQGGAPRQDPLAARAAARHVRGPRLERPGTGARAAHARGAILVDRTGRRFIDEGLGGIAHSNALARKDDPLCATAVFDQAIWDTAGKAETAAPNPLLVNAGGTLISAPDLAMLASKI